MVLAALLVAASLAAAPARSETPFLWKVEGGPRPSYLFGMVHRLPLERLPAPLLKLLREASTAVFEAEHDETLFDRRPELFYLPQGQTLETVLGPGYWAKLSARVDPSVDRAVLARLRPVVAMAYVKPNEDSSSGPTMDDQLERLARRHGVRVAGLETPEEHYTLADSAYTAQAVRLALDHFEEFERASRALDRAYLAGDEAAFEAAAASVDHLEPPSVSERLLKKRNRDWLPALESHISAGGAFIAVGASHLVGPDGLPQLLRAKGYAVTRAALPAGRRPSNVRGLPPPAPGRALQELDQDWSGR